MPEQKYPTSVSLSPEVRKKLKAYGQPRGWAVSRLCEYIINEWLKYQEARDQEKKK